MVNTSLLSQEELHLYLDHSQILFSYPINRNTIAIQSMLLHKGTNPAKQLEDPALPEQNLICKPEKPKHLAAHVALTDHPTPSFDFFHQVIAGHNHYGRQHYISISSRPSPSEASIFCLTLHQVQ